MTVPAGLSKRWENDPAKKTAEEFTLSTYEINPSVAFEVSEHLAVALGFRAIYSDGKVKSYATSGANVISRDLVGDHWDYGYNFALSFQPEEYMRFALTYRSKIVLEPEGNAKLTHAFGTKYNGWAKVAVPVPSALNVATAFDLNKDTTLELTYERTYWSEYTDLDFSYSSQLTDVIPGTGLYTSFDKPQARNWKNTNTYRIGLTHQQDEKSTVMLGFAYDNNPVPEETLGYELPDSDAIILSFGMKYKASEKLTYGFAFLYDKKESRQVNQTTGSNPINGEFSGSKAYLLTMGAQYSF
jgi:long-chain fatty acid transport protein